MKVAIDNNILSWLLSNAANPPVNKTTGDIVEHADARLSELKRRVAHSEIEPLLLPMPVVGELFSVHAGAKKDFKDILQDQLLFTLADFGMRAAIELGDVNNKYYASGDKRAGQAGTWAKLKADRMIYAVAKANDVDVMYTDDDGLTAVCEDNGITVIHSWDLPLPHDAQYGLV